MAAGDWLVQDGTVFYLNASSGHYRPTVANMHLFAAIHQRYWGGLLKFPPRKNGKLRTAAIQPSHKGKLYYIDDFVMRSEAAPAIEPEWLGVVAGALDTSAGELTKHA